MKGDVEGGFDGLPYSFSPGASGSECMVFTVSRSPSSQASWRISRSAASASMSLPCPARLRLRTSHALPVEGRHSHLASRSFNLS